MSTFLHPLEIGDFEGTRFQALNALVDTGATYSTVPSNILVGLGVRPTEERRFTLADGRSATFGLAWTRVRLDGREQPTLVVFGLPDARPLLGSYTLEGFGLMADPVNERLVPAEAFLVGISERPG